MGCFLLGGGSLLSFPLKGEKATAKIWESQFETKQQVAKAFEGFPKLLWWCLLFVLCRKQSLGGWILPHSLQWRVYVALRGGTDPSLKRGVRLVPLEPPSGPG